MKVNMVLYSHTGHTMRVGERISQVLHSNGIEVLINRLETVERLNFQALSVRTKEIPLIEGYDVIILGTPVHGGRMSAPLRFFIDETPSFENIPFIVFATHLFRRGWGGTQTIQSVRKLCEGKGGIFLGAADVKWLSFFRGQEITRAVDDVWKFLKKSN